MPVRVLVFRLKPRTRYHSKCSRRNAQGIHRNTKRSLHSRQAWYLVRVCCGDLPDTWIDLDGHFLVFLVGVGVLLCFLVLRYFLPALFDQDLAPI